MHPEHALLLAELRAAAPPTSPGGMNNDSYGGSGRPFFGLAAPARRDIARRWAAGRRDLAPAEVLAVIDSLSQGETHEERTQGALLLAAHRSARLATRPQDVERWLGRLNGWAEVDCLCQNLFTWSDFSGDWAAWRAMIGRLRRSGNINQRRAALVLLTGPVRASDDPRLVELALEVLDALKGERQILITKAVSWLLRSLAVRHRERVARYLEMNASTLPAVALRETRIKLATGTKSGRSRSAAALAR